MHIRSLALLLLLPALAQAQMYRWIDESGKVHYSDQAPPSSARSVEKKSVPGNPSASPPLPYALQQAVRDFPVTLYTSETCEPCIQARELLNRRGVPYKDVNISDVDGLEKLTGATGVPVMTVGRETYKGFESGAYQAALDNAGYPSMSQLPAGVPAREAVKPAPKRAPAAPAGDIAPAAAPKQAPDAGAPKRP
jgi:glutaredoxin